MERMIRLIALSLLVGATCVGCGEEALPAMPEAVVGTYEVDVALEDRRDATQMNVVLGSQGTVLLSFTTGISTIRARVMGSTALELPRQTIRIAHATGLREGLAEGGGSISAAGAVDVTVDFGAPGLTPDAGAAVAYRITGQRR